MNSNLNFDLDWNLDLDLQLDLDPPEITYEVLLKLPFDTVKFSVITYEHDYYYSKEYKEKSRNFLLSKGYELLVNDVSMEGVNSFEDWWVHPDLVTKERRELLKYVELNKVTNIQEYMLEKSQKVRIHQIQWTMPLQDPERPALG